MISYLGSKWLAVPKYPAPQHPLIIEPFAGSAGYSLRYADHDVWLADLNPCVVDLWRYLIAVDPDDILRLPDLPHPRLTPPQRSLIGFWLAKGRAQPGQKLSPWAAIHPNSSWWGPRVRQRIADQVKFIRHWCVLGGDYRELPNVKATWFIDPPYRHHGNGYPYGPKAIDYRELAEWCRSRKGQVIVCEGEGARWLPFRHLANGRRQRTKTGSVGPSEMVWTR